MKGRILKQGAVWSNSMNVERQQGRAYQGDLLPPCPMPGALATSRCLDPSQAALRPAQALQTYQGPSGLSAKPRRARMAGIPPTRFCVRPAEPLKDFQLAHRQNHCSARLGRFRKSAMGPGCVKTLAIFLCDGPVGLDDLSGCIFRFCRFVCLTGSQGPRFAAPGGDSAG